MEILQIVCDRTLSLGVSDYYTATFGMMYAYTRTN